MLPIVPTGAAPGRAGALVRGHGIIRTKAQNVGHRPGGKLAASSELLDELAGILFVFVAEDVAGDLHDR